MVGFLRESIHRILTTLLRAIQIFKKEVLNQCIFLKKILHRVSVQFSFTKKKQKLDFDEKHF